ncbi:MAG: hypothetical protein JXQ29_11710 [Planctomycetes bacterium]|nr:hypothetical protein [Planctomycetota bacterium]
MRYFMYGLVLIGTLAWLVCVPAATAQPVTGEIVLSNAGGLYGNAVIAMGRFGPITTILPLPAGAVGGVVCNQVGNEDLIAVGNEIWGVNNGIVRKLAGSLAFPVQGLDVDEDCTWLMAAGPAVLGLNPVAGKRTTVAEGFKNASVVKWNGSDGSLLVIDAGDNTIYAVARDGTKRIVAQVPGVKSLCWNAYTGHFFVAAPDILYDMTPGGVLTTLDTGKPGLKNTTDMFLRNDGMLLVVQGNAEPTGIYSYYAHSGRYNRPYVESPSAALGINPMGVTVDHYRSIWPVGATSRVGETVRFGLNLPHYKGKSFVAALSFGHAPGLRLGNYRLHLNLDTLFSTSLSIPAIFQNYGQLGTSGTARVALAIPNVAGLAGLRIFIGAVVLDPSAKDGVAMTTCACGFTIQPKE